MEAIRLIYRALLCLALGLATTVGIAWLCALVVDYNGPGHVFRREGAPGRPPLLGMGCSARGSEWVITGLVGQRGVEIEPLNERAYRWSKLLADPDNDGFLVSSEEARGWPFLCLRWIATGSRQGFEIQGGIDLNGDARAAAVRQGETEYPVRGEWVMHIEAGSSTRPIGGPSTKVLPYRPIWSGLLGNTAVYGLFWALIWSAFHEIRGIVRTARGRCSKCGYDLRGTTSSGCPECGDGRDRTVGRHFDLPSNRALQDRNEQRPRRVVAGAG
jgi:hypothetical protein